MFNSLAEKGGGEDFERDSQPQKPSFLDTAPFQNINKNTSFNKASIVLVTHISSCGVTVLGYQRLY